MNTLSLTWIFAFNNEIMCHIPDIYAGDQFWQQNICNLMKILIMDVFQIAKTELNETTLKT